VVENSSKGGKEKRMKNVLGQKRRSLISGYMSPRAIAHLGEKKLQAEREGESTAGYMSRGGSQHNCTWKK